MAGQWRYSRPDTNTDSASMRILLLEDTDTDREIVSRAGGRDFSIDECTSLEEAKATFNGHEAVLGDLHLSDGTEPTDVMDWLMSLSSPRLVYTITDDLGLARELGRRHLQFIRKSHLTERDLLFTLNWAAGAHEDFAERERKRRQDAEAFDEIRQTLAKYDTEDGAT